MISPSTDISKLTDPLWFCLKAQSKREHIAAASLRQQMNIPCLSPRLRFRKLTSRGAVWFVEAMFPGYLFAQFVYQEQHRQVEYSTGIQSIVRFGEYLPTMDDESIERLRIAADDEEVVTLDPELKVGHTVQITEGPFQGLEALVTHLIPARERVRVLLEFLGRSIETDVSRQSVLSREMPRP